MINEQQLGNTLLLKRTFLLLISQFQPSPVGLLAVDSVKQFGSSLALHRSIHDPIIGVIPGVRVSCVWTHVCTWCDALSGFQKVSSTSLRHQMVLLMLPAACQTMLNHFRGSATFRLQLLICSSSFFTLWVVFCHLIGLSPRFEGHQFGCRFLYWD